MIKKIIILGLIAISFVACGDSNDGGSGGSTVKSGTFSDSEVEGISYSTSSQQGETDVQGTFKYKDGEEVMFEIGGITIGSATGESEMTPMTLLKTTNPNDPKVLKILMFLQSIDSDHNASNGITISDELKEDAESETTHFTTDDVNLTDLYDILKVKKEHQVSKEKAKAHFKKSLDKIKKRKKKNATGFAIIEDIYQDGTVILDITDKGVINSYKYDQIDSCIKAVESGDKGYNINGKSLKYDDKQREFTIDDIDAGWRSNVSNEIINVFVGGISSNTNLNLKSNNITVFLTTKKSTKYHTSADIEHNMCTIIGTAKKYENIKGVYQLETFENSDADAQAKVRASVTHIDTTGKIQSYKYDTTNSCLAPTVSGDYNFLLNGIILSKGKYKYTVDDNDNLIEYFNLDSNSYRVSWLEDNGIISKVAFQVPNANPTVNNQAYINIDNDKMYLLTIKKSTTYTEANLQNSMCTN